MELAFVETSVGMAEAAESRIREAREFFVATGNLWYTSVAGRIPRAKRSPRRIVRVEFLRLRRCVRGDPCSSPTGRYLVKRQVVLARAHLLRGSPVEAEAAARRALKLLEFTDLVTDHAYALLVLADVLDARDLGEGCCDGSKRRHRETPGQGEPGGDRPPQRVTAWRRTGRDTPFSTKAPADSKATSPGRTRSTTSGVTRICPGFACSAILAATFTVRPK